MARILVVDDEPAIRALLAKVRDIDSTNTSISTEFDSVAAELHHVCDLSHEYVQQLHASGFRPLLDQLAVQVGVLQPDGLRDEMTQFRRRVPVHQIGEHQELWTDQLA